MRHCVSERLITLNLSFLVAQLVKNLPAMQETWIQYLGMGRSPGEGNGSPLQYSCLENSMNRGAWQATVQGVARVRHDLATKPPPPLSSHLQDYFKHKKGPPLHTGEGWGSLPRGNDGYIDLERQREKNE